MPTTDTKLILPFLSPIYQKLAPYGYAIMRATSGAMIASFGWVKLFGGGMGRDIELFHQLGIEPALPFAYFTSGLEFFGGVMIALGLLTRPAAAMLLGEVLVILAVVSIPRGSGYQLSALWAGLFLFILLRGGRRISVDRLLGWEF